MRRSYNREELLRLRESPLITKPTNLPPLQEWMGQPPDSSQKRVQNNRSRPDDGIPPEQGSTRRPALPSRTSRFSSTAPEDIVLGPPRTAFASAAPSRNTNKASDLSAPDAQQIDDSNGNDDTTTKRPNNFRDRFSKDYHRQEREAEDDRRASINNHRRGLTGDRESWTRLRREDGGNENGHSSNGDRPLGKPRNLETWKSENREANGDRSRQSTPTSGAHDSIWHNGQEHQRSRPPRRENMGSREWGDHERNRPRQQRRGWEDQQEQDPEWMAEPENDTKKQQSHTQEDFQRWKEKMKAGNKTAPETITSVQQKSEHERTISISSNTFAKGKAETPLVLSNGFDDGFFSVLADNRKESNTERSHGNANGPAVRTGRSKFTNFFAPKTEPQPPKESLQPTVAPMSAPIMAAKAPSDEDKEGFERILGLLGQSQRATIQQDLPQNHHTQDKPGPSPAFQEQEKEHGAAEGPLNGAKDNGPHQDRNSEFLLHLMQQPGQSRPQSNSNGSSQFSNLFPQSQSTPQILQTPSAPPGFPIPNSRPMQSEMDRRIREARQQAAGNSFFDTLPRPTPPEPQPDNGAGMQRPPPGLNHLPSNFQPYGQTQQPQNMPPGLPPNIISPPPGFSPNPMMAHQMRPLTQQHHAPQSQQPAQQPQYGMFPQGPVPNAIGPPQQQQQQHPPGRPPPPHGFMSMPPPGFGNLVNGRSSPPVGFYNDYYRG